MRRLISIPILLISIAVSGTNYYVRNGGNDSNTGLSHEQAWAHHPWMSSWTGIVTLTAGDIVYMNRGDIWTLSAGSGNFMTVGQSGTAGHHITTTAYGTGARPKISVTFNNMAAVIAGVAKNYITFDNLEISHYTSNYGMYGMGISITESVTSAPHDWTITNCEIHNIPHTAIYTYADCYNMVVGDTTATITATPAAYSNHIHDFGYAGVQLMGTNPATLVSNNYIYYNYVHDATRGTAGENEYGIYFSGGGSGNSSGWPKYCFARFNNVQNIKTWECYDIHGGSYIYFTDNYAKNFGFVAFQIGTGPQMAPVLNHIYVERNTIEQPVSGWVTGRESAFMIFWSSLDPSVSSDIYIRDNTLFYTSRPAYGLFNGITVNGANGLTISGNKIYNGSTASGNGAIFFQSSTTYGNRNVTIENNFINQWGPGIDLYGNTINGSLNMTNNIISKPANNACLRIIGGNIPASGSIFLYNNVFLQESYSHVFYSAYGIVNGGSVIAKNNILGRASPGSLYYWFWGATISGTFMCDNNIYWNSSLSNPFFQSGGARDWTYWTLSLKQDTHGQNSTDPKFRNFSGSYLQDLDFNIHNTSPAVDAGVFVGLKTDYAGTPISGLPDIGAFEAQTVTINPVFVSSVIENAAPSVVEMTYNLTLANIVPAASAFIVNVNSVPRAINTVAVSGTKVMLTLSSPVVNGNVVTVAYAKPATNPLQTASGGQALSLNAQTVSNKVNPVIPVSPVNPVYVSSSIGNATPAVIEMIYDLTLASVVPSASAFTVNVNSVPRAINTVAVSGTKVMLTLASPVVNGNVVTVAYTKPATNPLQTASGGQASSLNAQTVSNKVNPVIPVTPVSPVYVSSSIGNATPAVLEMIYDQSLASVVPSASAFTVSVNSATRKINAVSVSGTVVKLTLASSVVYGDIVTVSYTKPSANQLQTASGGQASSLSAQPVTNKVAYVAPPPVTTTPAVINTPPVVVINSPPDNLSGFVGELDATGSYDLNNDNLSYTWVAPANVPVSATNSSRIQFLGPIVNVPQTVEFILRISDGKTTQSKSVKVVILPYKPDLEVAEVVNIEASGFQTPFYPYNILDGNIGTMWSVNGDNQWLVLELKELFSIQHIKLAFQPGQKRESYFDILGSSDKENWEPLLIKSASCSFSGDLQVFEFPPSKEEKEFSYVKLIGRCNSIDTWNYISELRIFGYPHRNSPEYEKLAVKIYPNPATDKITIRIDEPTFFPDFIQITDLSGTIVYKSELDPGLREFAFPIYFKKGFYLLQLISGNLTLFAQKLIVKN